MTDAAWKAGYRALLVAFPYPALDRESAREREQLYREHLVDVAEGTWAAAVRLAIEGETERTFPPVARLLQYARSVVSARALPAPRRSPEQIEKDRSTAKRGLELVRAAVAKVPTPPAPQPYVEPVTVVVVTPERVAELKAGLQKAGNQQARERGTR